MGRIAKFVRTTAIGGLLVIVPIAVILFVLGQVLFGLYAVVESVVTSLKLETRDALLMFAIAVGALVGLCFVTGMLVQTRIGRRLKVWFSKNVGRRIPMFNALSSLTKRFVGLDSRDFAPVEVDLFGSQTRAIGFLIEKLPNDRCSVFIPSAPVATVGNVYVVNRSQVTQLNASVADALTAVSQWGVDASLMYKGVDTQGVDVQATNRQRADVKEPMYKASQGQDDAAF